MKKADVEIGQTYLMRVSGRIARVRVDRKREIHVYGYRQMQSRTVMDGENLDTGRRLYGFTAARLRGPATTELSNV